MSGLALNHWEKRVVRKPLKADAVVVKSFENDEKLYLIEGLGKTASLSVDRLIEKGVLVPLPDGLFGESQTYRLAAMTPELAEAIQ